MSRRSIAPVALSAVALISGCEVVLGIDEHSSRPLAAQATAAKDAAADATSSGDGGPPCVLPSLGDAFVRFGDLVPTFDRYDICVAAEGSPPAPAPLVASSGPGCPAGLGYEDILAPIGMPVGTYTVTVVPAGAACDAAPVLSLPSLVLASGATANVILYGDGSAAAPLAVAKLAQSTPAVSFDTLVRLVNFAPLLPHLDFGVADAPNLPATIYSPLLTEVGYGGVAAPGDSDAGAVDTNGYSEFSAPMGFLSFGAAYSRTNTAVLVKSLNLRGNDTYSFYAVGEGTPSFPRELLACDELQTFGIYTQCTVAPPVDVTVDSFNAYLWGPFAPLVSLRTQPIIDALSTLDSDVVCVTEMYSDANKQALVAEAAPEFPYAVVYSDTLDTKIDDAVDQAGNIPAAPTTPPCASEMNGLDQVLGCVSASCSTNAGDDGATLGQDPVDCLTTNCSDPIAALLYGSGAAQACWSCIFTQLAGDATIGDARNECSTDPRARYAFDGASSTVLLSRYPVLDQEQWVLGSTEWRVAVSRARLGLPGGASVDAYCTELTSPQSGATHPYTGSYGGGLSDSDDEWAEELRFQTTKLASFVTARSASVGEPAIVSGQFYAGPSLPPIVDGVFPAAYASLVDSFALAAAPGFSGACTSCQNNLITNPPGTTPTGASTWTTLTFLRGIPVTNVQASSVILDQPVLPYMNYDVPLSTYYGYRTVVRIRR